MKTLISVGTGGHPIVSVLISLYNYKKYIENNKKNKKICKNFLKNFTINIGNFF